MNHGALREKSCYFRQATLDDLNDIMEINNQFQHNWTKEKFHDVFSNNIPMIVIYDDFNVIIGYLVYFIILDEGRIINITINQKYQNQSFGRQLMNKALEEMYQNNVHYALLDVKTDNFIAIHLYTKMGFQILCRRNDYYTGDVNGDSYFMQLKL